MFATATKRIVFEAFRKTLASRTLFQPSYSKVNIGNRILRCNNIQQHRENSFKYFN